MFGFIEDKDRPLLGGLVMMNLFVCTDAPVARACGLYMMLLVVAVTCDAAWSPMSTAARMTMRGTPVCGVTS